MGYTYAINEQPYRVTAFTEKVSGDKIQIRIGGIETYDALNGGRKSVSRLQGSPELAPGLIIWDDAINWQPCS